MVGVLSVLPAAASSLTTESFLAVVQPTVAFLATSSGLAESNSDNPRIRAFARAEIQDQAIAQAAIADWGDAERRREARNAAEPTLDGLGPIAGLIATPFDALADATSLASPPLTGLPSAHRLEAIGQTDLAQLTALHGRDFDRLFADQQANRLFLLAKTYEDFIKNGDDPALRALAVHNLPRIKGLLAHARRL
jgi:predicted outer membrane protein